VKAMSILEAISPTAKTLLANDPLPAEIGILRRRVLGLYSEQRDYLASKPGTFLEELMHRADEERFNSNYSVRVAAEINRTACALILEARQAETQKLTN